MPSTPTLQQVEEHVARFRSATGGDGESGCPDAVVDGWQLKAMLCDNGERLAVLELADRECSRLVYVGASGARRELRWNLGELEALAGALELPTYPAGYFQAVLNSNDDLLAQHALTADGEVDVEALRSLLPPLVEYTFLGDCRLEEKPIVEPNGDIPGYFGAGREYDPCDATVAWHRTLVNGSLPVVVTAFWDKTQGVGREEIALVRPDDKGINAEVWIRLRANAGHCTYLRCRGEPQAASAASFYQEALQLAREQDALLAPAATIVVPDRQVMDNARAALLRGFGTFVGLHPKYGVKEYGKARGDSFPPAICSLAGCALEWGLFDQGKALLGHWLQSFVNADGSFDYYGPALSEYGQMLALVARCFELTQDREWFEAHRPIALRIAERLCRLRAANLCHARASPLYGLIPSNPEADYTDMKMPENVYYSGDAWAYRGLAQLAKVLGSQDECGVHLAQEALNYLSDIRASIAQNMAHAGEPPFLPIVAGNTERYHTLTESEPASYANYRFYPELLSSGVLTAGQQAAVLGYRWTHGGDVLATSRIWDCLDDWPAGHYACGLLASGNIDRVKLLFYSHLMHHHGAGWQTAFEAVRIDCDPESVRRRRTDYCVCAQLVVPLLLKWMLAWEPYDSETLWLNRATPRAWQQPGQEIEARDLPTRWGKVNLRVRGESDRAWAVVRLENPVPRICLQLHAPTGEAVSWVKVNGEPWLDWDAGGVINIVNPPLDLEVEAG